MGFLYFLEQLRFPLLNELMLLITQLGEETAFLVAALIVFWCVDKKKGYFLLAVGFLGTMFNSFLKLLFRVPRPWIFDPDFSVLEQAKEAAGGYSFPSGHTQTAVGTFGSLAVTTDKKWWRICCITLAALVGFSRMYVGVHTLYDVLAGAAVAVVLILALKPIVFSGKENAMKVLLAGMIALAVAFLLYVELWNFPTDMDQHNLASGYKNAYTLIGCLVGVAIVYVADRKWLDFPVEAVWWVQIMKVVVGFLLVLAVKEGLRAPLELLLPVYPARAVRYFLIVITGGIIWPMTFAKLSKLGKK